MCLPTSGKNKQPEDKFHFEYLFFFFSDHLQEELITQSLEDKKHRMTMIRVLIKQHDIMITNRKTNL